MKLYHIGRGASLWCPVPRCWSEQSLLILPVPDDGYSYARAHASLFRWTLSSLLVHLVVEHVGDVAFMALVRIGVLDGTCEAGDAFWRLDFWRAHYRRALKNRDYVWHTKPALWGA